MTGGATYPPLPSGNNGIAANYPNDVGIGADARVLYFDDFESYSTTSPNFTAAGKWNNAYGTRAIDTTNFFAGAKALRETVPANANDNTGNNAIGLEKNLTGSLTTVFIRTYAKFPSNWSVAAGGSQHNGPVLSGNYCGPGQGAS